MAFDIHIRNIGPLVDTGRLHVTDLTLIIGKQSTGKSTLMKIACFCSWVEKQVVIGERNFIANFTHYSRFLKELMKFHRMAPEEFSTDSYISYESDIVTIRLAEGRRNVEITRKPAFKELAANSKISFVPAERNFLTSIQNIEKIYRTSNIDNIFNFILEWRDAKQLFTTDNKLDLVVAEGMKYYYDKKTEKEVIALANSKRITPFYASSGVQSVLPLLVVANYLKWSIGQQSYSADNFVAGADLERFTYKFYRLFVEEPEQNLFPESQYQLLLELTRLLQSAPGSSMMLTSHSPYILTAVNILIEAVLASTVDKEKAMASTGLDINLGIDSFAAYSIGADGHVENIIDPETHLIKGEYLDSISDTYDETTYKLNTIIYGDD